MAPFWVVSALLCLWATAVQGLDPDPEIKMDAIELITSKGYPAEAHWVTTTDGYILGLHRIPHRKNETQMTDRPVFFLQHGLLCSSANWLTNLEDESLAYILADNGFDVWMGNVRGNDYSRNHTTLKVNTKAFWDFSFDEHSLKDLPAMLDYVTSTTGRTKIYYVGHSQGAIMGFAGFTTNATLANYIRAFFALAPVSTVKHIEGAFKYFAEVYPELEVILDIFGHGEFFPQSALTKFLAKTFCPLSKDIEHICEDFIFVICGFDEKNINTTRVPVYYAHTPAGTSVKDLVHLSQEVKSGKFEKFDYGKKGNLNQYGTKHPPEYNVSELNVPTALFTGGQDWLADPQDVAGLIPKINNTVFYHLNISYYDHLDFIWGLDAHKMVYKPIVDIAKCCVRQNGGQDWLADPQDVAGLIPKINNTVFYHLNISYYDNLDFIWGLDAHKMVYKPIVDIAKQ